jgi:hypothetical protein
MDLRGKYISKSAKRKCLVLRQVEERKNYARLATATFCGARIARAIQGHHQISLQWMHRAGRVIADDCLRETCLPPFQGNFLSDSDVEKNYIGFL